MADPLTTLSRGAARLLGRALTESETGRFSKYLELLLKWQKTARLVGRANPGWIVENLFLDSLLFLRALPRSFTSLLDLGAGAGLPGIPIAIVRPETALVLIEARQRRASFLSTTIRELGLSGVEVINARAEDVVDRFSNRFDAVVMRCAGQAEVLIPLATKFVHQTGCVVVSGPPSHPKRASSSGWIEVPGLAEVRAGAPRRFRVVRGDSDSVPR
jgi:16S rRNA (guanine527-N7)-methyltransferase